SPPPRLVKCNFTWEFRSVSVRSANGRGVALGAAVAATPGWGATVAVTDAAGVALTPGTVGGGVVATAGRGAACREFHICQAKRPSTQRVTAIHAVRSINHLRLLTRRRSSAPVNLRLAQDQIRCRPTDDIAATVSVRNNLPEEPRAVRPPANNIPSTSAKIGSPRSRPRAVKGWERSLFGSRE